MNTAESAAMMKAILHKYENTTRLKGKAKFEEVIPGEVWKHVDASGRRFNIVNIGDDQYRIKY